MIESLKETILKAEQSGTQSVLNIIQNNKFELNQFEHTIRVIEFCDLLEIMSDSFLENRSAIYLQFQVKKKKHQINDSIRFINYIEFSFKDHEQNIISEEIKEIYPRLYFLINEYLMNFYDINTTFINPNFHEKIMLFSLTAGGIEDIRQNLLNKDIYTTYQYTKLLKMLNQKNEYENLIKV